MAQDPVCGMNVDESEARFKSDYAGKQYYFCSQDCKETFESKPEQYAVSAA
jgi:YHS domain-containing protein